MRPADWAATADADMAAIICEYRPEQHTCEERGDQADELEHIRLCSHR
jgi:hypothetical protein